MLKISYIHVYNTVASHQKKIFKGHNLPIEESTDLKFTHHYIILKPFVDFLSNKIENQS